jgi:hypothetical protein
MAAAAQSGEFILWVARHDGSDEWVRVQLPKDREMITNDPKFVFHRHILEPIEFTTEPVYDVPWGTNEAAKQPLTPAINQVAAAARSVILCDAKSNSSVPAQPVQPLTPRTYRAEITGMSDVEEKAPTDDEAGEYRGNVGKMYGHRCKPRSTSTSRRVKALMDTTAQHDKHETAMLHRIATGIVLGEDIAISGPPYSRKNAHALNSAVVMWMKHRTASPLVTGAHIRALFIAQDTGLAMSHLVDASKRNGFDAWVERPVRMTDRYASHGVVAITSSLGHAFRVRFAEISSGHHSFRGVSADAVFVDGAHAMTTAFARCVLVPTMLIKNACIICAYWNNVDRGFRVVLEPLSTTLTKIGALSDT